MDLKFRPFNERKRIDIALIIVLRSEWLAFCHVFKEFLTDYATESLEDPKEPIQFRVHQYSITAAFVNMGRSNDQKLQGKIAAASFTSWLLSKFEPRTVAVVGIAAAVNSAKGEVVVATGVIDENEDSEAIPDGDDFKLVAGLLPIVLQPTADRILECFPYDRDDGQRVLKMGASAGGPPEPLVTVRAGPIVTSSSVSKSGVFKAELAAHHRRMRALEMESFAICTAAVLLSQETVSFACIRALSDEGGLDKADRTSSTNDETWKREVSKRAFRVFRKAIENKALEMWPLDYLPPPAIDAPDAKLTGAFPFFVPDDIVQPQVLRDVLLGPRGKKRSAAALREFFEWSEANHHSPGGPDAPLATLRAAQDEASAQDALVSLLNNALVQKMSDAEPAVVGFRGAFDRIYGGVKARKVVSEVDSDNREHTQATKTRLMIEALVNSIARDAMRTTPIVTCLVEKTASRLALEVVKKAFEVENRVVLDFDGVRLADLYEQTEWELLKEQQQVYDIVFTYHLQMGIIGAKAHLSDHSGTSGSDTDTRLVFPSVLQEVAHTEGDDAIHHKPGFTPVNANTMVLLVNEELCHQHSVAFERYGGDGGFPTDQWSQIKTILKFFKQRLNRPGICMAAQRAGDCAYFEWLSVITALDARVFGKEYGWQPSRRGDIRLMSRETLAATEEYVALKDYHPTDMPAPYETDMDLQYRRFCRGDIPLAIVWSDMLDLYWQTRGAGLRVVPLPGRRSVIGVGVCCINARAQSQAVASKFVHYLQKPNVQRELALAGWCSALPCGYDEVVVPRRPYLTAVAEALRKEGGAMEASKKSELIRRRIGEGLDAMLRGDVAVDRALEAMMQDVVSALDYD